MNNRASTRSQHVDALRGLAVLAMVQVHTAALLPAPVEMTHILAFVSAAIGGMAAPLFVTLSGWSVHRGLRRRIDARLSITRWLYVRIISLFLLQLVINLLLPQRFKWYTPGVLSLLALCTLLTPLMLRGDQIFYSLSTWFIPSRARLISAIAIVFVPVIFFIIFPTLVPEQDWWWFVSASSVKEWCLRLFISGTYPVFPWVVYFLIGGILEHGLLDTGEKAPLLRRSGAFAFATIILTGVVALSSGRRWAMTIGDGLLTFFPANPWFVLVSLAWTVFLWNLFRAYSDRLTFLMRLLASSGRLSLTIYVFHFAILCGLVPFFSDDIGIGTVFIITFAHVLLWFVLSILHQSIIPNVSLEVLLRTLSSGTKSQSDSNDG